MAIPIVDRLGGKRTGGRQSVNRMSCSRCVFPNNGCYLNHVRLYGTDRLTYTLPTPRLVPEFLLTCFGALESRRASINEKAAQ